MSERVVADIEKLQSAEDILLITEIKNNTHRLHLANRSSGMCCSLLQCKSMISSIGELPRLSGNVTSRLLLTSINLSFFRLTNILVMREGL